MAQKLDAQAEDLAHRDTDDRASVGSELDQ
jgi:hypothetical protein